jgi:hypothetical protein
MTAPDDNRPADDNAEGNHNAEGNIEAGALAAASHEDDAAGDPLAPLNAVTEDDDKA